VLSEFHADHILPVELGGETSLMNLQLLCVPCHAEKSRADLKRIRKAARLRRRAEGNQPKKRRIESRGFPRDPLSWRD